MRVLLLCLLLVACSPGERPSDEARAARKARREAAAAEHAAKPPEAQEHYLKDGALVVLDVPVTDGSGSKDRQKCFVWRDAEFKTANITCPSREVFVGNN